MSFKQLGYLSMVFFGFYANLLGFLNLLQPDKQLLLLAGNPIHWILTISLLSFTTALLIDMIGYYLTKELSKHFITYLAMKDSIKELHMDSRKLNKLKQQHDNKETKI